MPARTLLLSALLAVTLSSCLGRRALQNFQVISKPQNYALRSPDSRDIPFPDLLRAYNGFEPGKSFIDLRPLMELRIENAYYRKGASRRGLSGFLGTELAHYAVTPHGLRLLAFQPMQERPADDLPVQQLVPPSEQRYRFYRLYFEIVFTRKDQSHGSVLLGAASLAELDELSAQLTHPDAVCNTTSQHCVIFPEACTVSVEMKIVVNGNSQTAVWGTLLSSIAAHPQRLELRRLYAGKLTPVQLDPHDPEALRLPLLPGDQLTWQ